MRGRPLNLWFLILGAILLTWAIGMGNTARPSGSLPYSTFLSEVDSGRVRSVVIEGDRIEGVLADGSHFVTYAPQPPETSAVQAWAEKGLEVEVRRPGGGRSGS